MMKTKWIAFMLAALMLLSSVSSFAASFDDVTEAHAWAKADIENYAERGILAGDGQGHFFPDNSVTRAEFAKMLCMVFGLDKTEEISYADVEKGNWQYDYIAKADTYTYTRNPEIYEPNKPASRAEIAYAIVKAAGFAEKAADMPFTDMGEINPALLENVNTAYALGLLKGYPDNTFRPNGAVTRAEAVVLLSRAEAVLAEQKPDEELTEPPKEEPEEEPNIRIEPMDTLCYVESVSERLDPQTEDELKYRVQFYVSGSETLYEMYIDRDVPIYSNSGTVQRLQGGDIICINTNLYGTVKEVHLVLRIGTMPLAYYANGSIDTFLEKLNVPTAHKWGYLEENKKHEVYLGFFGDIQFQNDGANGKLWIYPGNGKKSSDETRVLQVSEDTKILTYEANLRKNDRYGFTTAGTVDYYGAPKDSYGNIVQESSDDWKVYQYVFVKAKDGIVTDILVVSNQ